MIWIPLPVCSTSTWWSIYHSLADSNQRHHGINCKGMGRGAKKPHRRTGQCGIREMRTLCLRWGKDEVAMVVHEIRWSSLNREKVSVRSVVRIFCPINYLKNEILQTVHSKYTTWTWTKQLSPCLSVHCVRQTEVNFSKLERQNRAILHQKRQNACTIHDK